MTAKNIHKMLKDGIHTWAPKLPVKKAVVYFSPRNIPEEVDVDHLRSIIIGETLVRMLEYSKVDVIRRNRLGDLYGMLIDFLIERLATEEVNDYLTTGEIEFGRFLDYLFERVPNGEVDDHTIGELEVFYKEWKKSFYGSAEFRRRAYQAQVLYLGADERYLNAWAQICEIDRKGYENIYQRLGVHVEEKSKSSCDFNIPEILDLLRKAEGLIEISRGKQVIFVKEKIWNPILSDLREKKKIPLTVVKKDGSYDYALTDLADLWYEVNEEKAEWIVYVADRGKEDYIEMCIAAARRAGWLPTDEDEYPRTTFVGYGLVEGVDLKRFRTSSTQVVDLLDEAKTRCKAALVEQGKADEWTAEELENTAEALGCGAVKYAGLKTNRLTNCTFNFDQMLNDKGNTAIYLLHTHARICSIIRKSGKDIEELKKAEDIILESDEERELGLHLLRFTAVVAEVCLVLRPHILCEYLYDLSEKFNSLYFSVCEQKVVGSAEETRQVLKNQEAEKLLGGVQTTTTGAGAGDSSASASALSELDDCIGHPTTLSVMRKCSYAEDAEETSTLLLSEAIALDTGIVGSAVETSNLLLCEATAVVMKKCLCLLGITPIYKI